MLFGLTPIVRAPLSDSPWRFPCRDLGGVRARAARIGVDPLIALRCE
jgi:hypothetical protein